MGAKDKTSFSHIPNNTLDSWWKDPGLRLNVLHCFGCCLCPFYLVNDQTLLAGLQAIPAWGNYFGNPNRALLGIITASLFLPAIVCSFIGDFLCTKLGRKYTIYIGSGCIVAGGIWNGMSQSVGQFIGSRVIVGIGGGITKVAAPALLHEIAHPRLRPTLGTLYYGFYHLGGTISAIMCIAGLYVPEGNWQWRMPAILQVFGPAMVLSILLFAPESPRWLASNGKLEQARQVLIKHHANGDADDQLVAWEYHEITHTIEAEKLTNKASYADFFKTKGNRKRLWVTCFLGMGSNWVGNGILGYYLAPVLRTIGITDPLTITGINCGLAAWNMVSSLTLGAFSEQMGRRPMWIISNVGMGFGFCFIMGFAGGFANTGKTSLGIAVIPFIFIVYGFYNLAWMCLNYTYTAEYLPYALRTKGLAIYITMNNLSNAFNQFVNPIALDSIAWRYYAVYIAIDFIVAIVAYFQFPETNRLSIEEVSLMFDYGVKEGRAKVLENMERQAAERDERRDKLAEDGKHADDQLEHTSRA